MHLCLLLLSCDLVPTAPHCRQPIAGCILSEANTQRWRCVSLSPKPKSPEKRIRRALQGPSQPKSSVVKNKEPVVQTQMQFHRLGPTKERSSSQRLEWRMETGWATPPQPTHCDSPEINISPVLTPRLPFISQSLPSTSYWDRGPRTQSCLPLPLDLCPVPTSPPLTNIILPKLLVCPQLGTIPKLKSYPQGAYNLVGNTKPRDARKGASPGGW